MAICYNLLLLLLLLLLLFDLIPSLAATADSINQTQSIKDGDTLVSSGGIFELGFFSPGSSTGRYVGIWYKDVQLKTVVWVANRNEPINGSSGVLKINGAGDLILLSQNDALIWSANSTGSAQNTVLQLLDTGNLVLRDGNTVSSSEVYFWQSFDYPTDTLLQGMKLGKDMRTGHQRSLTSWKSPDDPSPGDLIWGLENWDFPELIGRKKSSRYYNSGPWVGLYFSQAPQHFLSNDQFSYRVVSSQDEVYFAYNAMDNSSLMRIVANQTTGVWEQSTWNKDNQNWRTYFSVPKDNCDTYEVCGVYSKCNVDAIPYCQCLTRFSPKFPDKWAANDWTGGCVRNQPLSYGTSDGFIKYTGLKLPDSTNTSVDSSSNLKDCRARCLKNSACMAYANSDTRNGGTGCAIWFSDAADMKELASGGQDLYIRMPASEIPKDHSKAWKVSVSVLVVVTAAAMVATLYYIRKKLQERARNQMPELENRGLDDELEFPSYDLATLAKATKGFENKLGEGGFGPVYKGILVDGKEIAVKRLSDSSTQGVKEFKNEVLLIANLQHRNLVKLLGGCIHGEERMLIYEFMPNGSLDTLIFDTGFNSLRNLTDQNRGKNLHWEKRFHIICGVARGLLYLHQDSRLRIIHRDLKASNVLLDDDMNPKISDFGMARIFGGDETRGNTKRVVGTYGYMAPEYAIDGLFSVKSDVFSFGVLVLETVSGRRNRGVYRSEHNLIGYAWKSYKEGNPEELIDPCMVGTCRTSEVLRSVHIALLCLQEDAEDRPSMASVVTMFSSEGTIPPPKPPRFLASREQFAENSSSSDLVPCSNEMTVTLVEAR